MLGLRVLEMRLAIEGVSDLGVSMNPKGAKTLGASKAGLMKGLALHEQSIAVVNRLVANLANDISLSFLYKEGRKS